MQERSVGERASIGRERLTPVGMRTPDARDMGLAVDRATTCVRRRSQRLRAGSRQAIGELDEVPQVAIR